MQSLIFAKVFYFLYYAAGASLIPFLAVYYQSVGFSGGQIGVLAAISPLMMLISSPIWGGISDSLQRHKQMLILSMSGAWTAVALLSQMKNFVLVLPVVILYAFFASPVIPLIDNSVMNLIKDRKGLYGKQRMWGAVGWGIAGPIIGALADRFGLQMPFWGYLFFMGCGLLTASRLVIVPVIRPESIWKGIVEIIRDRKWWFFLVAVFISGTGMAIITNFLFLYFNELGINRTTMGLALSLATLSEIPILFFSGYLIHKWGYRTLLIASMVAGIVRSLGYAIFPILWIAMGLQLLHGLTFSGMWVAGVSFASENAPPGLGATAQSLFFSVVFGISSITGAISGGLLFQNFGGVNMFLWSGIVLLLSTALYVVAERINR